MSGNMSGMVSGHFWGKNNFRKKKSWENRPGINLEGVFVRSNWSGMVAFLFRETCFSTIFRSNFRSLFRSTFRSFSGQLFGWISGRLFGQLLEQLFLELLVNFLDNFLDNFFFNFWSTFWSTFSSIFCITFCTTFCSTIMLDTRFARQRSRLRLLNGLGFASPISTIPGPFRDRFPFSMFVDDRKTSLSEKTMPTKFWVNY